MVRKGHAFGCVEATPRWSGCHDIKHGGMCVHAGTDQGAHTSQVKPRGGIGKRVSGCDQDVQKLNEGADTEKRKRERA